MDNVLDNINGPPMCVKCSAAIFDGTVLHVRGQFWHSSCLRCDMCRKMLDAACHYKDNAFYCKDDFIRTFGARCSACSDAVSPSENANMVNGHVFHTSCFTCSVCTCSLQPGNYFYLAEDARLLCNADYQQILARENCDSPSETDESGSDDADPRMRICDLQLRTLLDAYAKNRRPTKNTRQQLSEITGLKSRTIQIWFQSKRSKDKEIAKRNLRNKKMMSEDCIDNISTQKYSNFQCESLQSSTGLRPENKHEDNDFQQDQHIVSTTGNISCINFDFYQLYCPLDYLVPNEMPPNVDLSSADLCNGEVISGRLKQGNGAYEARAHFNYTQNMNWLSV